MTMTSFLWTSGPFINNCGDVEEHVVYAENGKFIESCTYDGELSRYGRPFDSLEEAIKRASYSAWLEERIARHPEEA